jgi:hypothetical protein
MSNQDIQERETSEVRSMLATLPRRKAGADLNVRLRVLASRQARRRRILASPATLAQEVSWRTKLWLENLVRPIAVPAAGGVISALFLFLTIAPAFPMRQSIVDDPPLRLATQATLLSAFSVSTPGGAGPAEDVVLDLEIDSEGKVVDYMVASGQAWTDDPTVRKSLESTLVCTRFTPATRFGQPQSGSVRITIRRSELEVRG